MNEIDPLEKQLQSWAPRRPSPKIAARLFGRDRRALAPSSHIWTWLTPAAACALTVLVAFTGASRHAVVLDELNSSAVATVMYDPESPNTMHTFVLSRGELGMQLNGWDHPWHPNFNASRLAPATNHSSNGPEL